MHSNEEKKFQEIFSLYLQDKASPAELELLFEWMHSGQADGWMDKALERAFGDPAFADAGMPGEKESVMASLREKMGEEEHGSDLSSEGRVRRMPGRWMIAAASILILAGVGYWLVLQRSLGSVGKPVVTAAARFEGRPGTTGAVLTLSDGTKVELDSTGAALPQTQGGARLSRKDNRLVYAGNGEPAAAEVYNTLVTPRGREYVVVLADGTRVWLNAGSSIRYPAAFTGQRREVTITGEVYLEVAADKDQPFIVRSNGASVTVLGTKFDVTDYGDESKASVTLLDGAVRVGNGKKDVLLTPGHRADLAHTDGNMSVRSEDGSRVIAWTRGLLDLDNDDFASLMRQISRWYDVDVVFRGMPSGIHIGGLLHRNVDLRVVLQYLGDNGVHYRAEGRTITILP